ncbi:cell division protein FtsW [Streptomyces narbonensis]
MVTNWVIVALLIRVSDSARAPQPDSADTGTLAPVREDTRFREGAP